jgi:hypothetical protein
VDNVPPFPVALSPCLPIPYQHSLHGSPVVNQRASARLGSGHFGSLRLYSARQGETPREGGCLLSDVPSTSQYVYIISTIVDYILHGQIGINFADKRRSLGRYNQLAD